MEDDRRPVRVAVDNDFPVVIRGVTAMLSGHTERVEVVETDPGSGAGADVVLRDSFGQVEDLSSYVMRMDPRVVVFAATDHDAAVQAALEAGVGGYVHKSVSVDRLVDALERVHAGEQVVVHAVRQGGPSVGTPDWPGRSRGLSDREAEVLTLICRGMSNQQIAEHLYLSVNSIKTYIRTMYRKIGVESRAQAVIWGLRHGFASEQDRTQSG